MEVDIADIPELRSSVGLCGFMELVFHHLMYVKNIYPKPAFRRCMRKNVPIWMCEHPGVQKYVINFLDFANKLLMQTKKLKICFVLCRRNKEVIEEFYFELKVKDMFVER
ncbi:hypothetical protein AVEN_92524-1 [Araneus ventricosus]|uniref:HORMA domain-containing protein n=1 Tax=Araneus ventricosus TaxID=182803 RepID=A0A4Y2AHP9_ARAVE|nr:hypothetical protein AVEN_92524-1 [Araneus ventricosus]